MTEPAGQPAKHSRGRKRFWIAIGVAAVVGLLAVASYWTTSMCWDGGFPSGEFRLTIRNSAGKPVPGALLRVYRAKTQDLTTGYPLDDHVFGNELVSDSNGQIVTVRKYDGLQFGGECWRLFWIIPFGVTKGPEYDCVITATGYKPYTFEVQRLFHSQHTFYDEFPKTTRKVDGAEVELKVYEQSFTLER